MWKKFLAVMAIVGLLSAQTATAGFDADGDLPQIDLPLKSLTVTPSTFNPGLGGTTEITVEVNEDSIVDLKVLDSKTGAAVATLYSDRLVEPAKAEKTTFGGILSNGSKLADGKYIVYAYLIPVSRSVDQEGKVDLTVVSTPAALAVDTLTVGSNGTLDLTQASKITFTFSANKDSTVTLVIKDAAGNTVKTLTALTGVKTGTFEWDGKDEAGKFVDAGTYTAALTATAVAETATKSANFIVKYDGVADGDIIKNVVIDPSPWDPSDEELTIEWELAKDVEEFSLTAISETGKKIELMEDEELDADDDYEFEWNGLDEDDDYIKEGTWILEIKADGDVLKPSVVVEYSKPEFYDDMFVTKTSFDNTIDEFTYVVFRVEQEAVVTVKVKDGNKKVDTLMDEEEVEKNTWYAVKWDGMDDDGDEVDEGTYKFEVTAANKANDDIETSKTIEVTVEEDTVSSGKSNVVNDFIYPVVVSKNTTSDVEIQFSMDEEAEVTVEIFKGNKTSNPEIVLMKNTLLKAGDYKMVWDARDEDGKKLDKNTKYSYRVTTKVEGSSNKTDKERGFFVIGEEAKGDTPTPPSPKPPSTEGCGFWDVTSSSQYCTAIAWAKAEGIFDGYPDGSFRQYSFINRAEALKVVLEAFEVSILPDDYTNLGFKDVSVGAWYMKYLRTGKFYGMVDGYGGTTSVKPGEEINRVELLKYTLEAAETINGYEVPVCNTKYYPDATDGWYRDYVCLAHDYDLYNTYSGYFYPGNAVARGEVALLLYRLNEAGLLQ